MDAVALEFGGDGDAAFGKVYRGVCGCGQIGGRVGAQWALFGCPLFLSLSWVPLMIAVVGRRSEPRLCLIGSMGCSWLDAKNYMSREATFFVINKGSDAISIR